MGHNLEVVDGQVAFALRGEPAWHKLANHIFGRDEVTSVAQFMNACRLNNWNVRLEDIALHVPNSYKQVIDQYLVLRDNPFKKGIDILGYVGSRYKPLQNEELFSFADNLLDGGAWLESGGSIKGGRVVFACLKMPKQIVLDPSGANDKTDMYLVLYTSHDGSVAIQAMITPVRVVCQNTLNLAMLSAKQSFKIRHTQTLDGRIASARQALGLTFAYADEFELEAKALFETAVTDKKFAEIVNAIYPKPAEDSSKVGLTKWENKVQLVNDLYFKSPTSTNVKGTAWGVANALTERIDYFRSGRGNSENLMASASGFDPVTTAEKRKIFSRVKVLAGVK